MRRAMTLGFLTVVLMGLGCRRAEANMWDWLEELSGPGPFGSRMPGPLMMNILCSKGTLREADKSDANKTSASVNGQVPNKSEKDSQNSSNKSWFLNSLLSVPEPKAYASTCLFVDRRPLHADQNDRFYPVSAMITEFGPSLRVHPSLEFGAGVGWIRFSSESPVRSFVATQPTFSSRVVFMPLLTIPALQQRKHAWAGIFKMYTRETIIFGTVNQNDVAMRSDSTRPNDASPTFSVKNDRVTSMGFLLDFTVLLRPAGQGLKKLF
jgi:hypothetical protein